MSNIVSQIIRDEARNNTAIEVKPAYLRFDQILGSPIIDVEMMLVYSMHPDEVKQFKELHDYIYELYYRVPTVLVRINLTLHQNSKYYRYLLFKECQRCELRPECANRTPNTLPHKFTFSALWFEASTNLHDMKVLVRTNEGPFGGFKTVRASELFGHE